MVVIAIEVLQGLAHSAAGIVDVSSVHHDENDAKWQETDVSRFNHAF